MCLLYCACQATCIFADPLHKPRAGQRFWNYYKTLTFCALLAGCRILGTCHTKWRFNVQKWPERPWCALCILTSKCASRHNSMHFFNIATSKNAPNPSVFNTFDLDTCFAPQQRALFEHVNFHKCSETGLFCAFWLANVLRGTTACTFATSQLLKVLRSWSVFCAFWLGNVLRATTACNFSSLIWPHGSTSSFFWLFLFFDLLSSSCLFSDSSRLCFCICPYCRKFDF